MSTANGIVAKQCFRLVSGKVGNLFPAHRSTVITLYNGAFDSSSAVFLIIKVLFSSQFLAVHTSHFSTNTLYIIKF